MGAVADSMEGKTVAERHEIKARAIKNLLDNLTERTFTRGLFAVTVASAEVTFRPVPTLELRVNVVRAGKPVPIDGHLRFINPPILVPTGETVMVDTGETDASGTPVMVAKKVYTEDVRAAMRAMVGEEIERQVRSLR